MFFQINTSHLKNSLFQGLQLVQLIAVCEFFLHASFHHLSDLEFKHEPLECVHDLFGRDVGAVDEAIVL